MLQSSLDRFNRLFAVVIRDVEALRTAAENGTSLFLPKRTANLVSDFYSSTGLTHGCTLGPIDDTTVWVPSAQVRLVGECICLAVKLDVTYPQEQDLVLQLLNGTMSDEVLSCLLARVGKDDDSGLLTSELALVENLVTLYRDLVIKNY